MWEIFLEKCEGMSPRTLMEFFHSEKTRILEVVEKRGKISEEEADFLNQATKNNLENILNRFKESFLEQIKLIPGENPEEVELKMSLHDQITQWLKNLFSWLKEKSKEIFSKLKEAVEWCFKKVGELCEYLWSLFQ